ncbi:MAG: hypothetical protein AB1490_11780 [Pseudomonadota bacterium]
MAALKKTASGIRIAKRYVRSVELQRDLEDPDALNGYVITPSVRDATERILAGLSASSTQRAFRVTGPYGAGKSAFALFLTRLLGDDKARCKAARSLLEAAGAKPASTGSYTPVVLVGRRANIADCIVEAIAAAAGGKRGGKRSATTAKLAAQIARERSKGSRNDEKVLALIGEYAKQTKSGVLLLIDEFGRFLEYAALNRRDIDPSFFQQLAEMAGGRQPQPVAVVAFLHHRFSDYAAGLGEWAEAEWTRSAERYEDILFHDSTEQTAFLIAQAIVHEPPAVAAAAAQARRLYGEAVARGLFATNDNEMAKVAASLLPLHPAAVAALANLATRFGQNERSVFGFLQSLEPFGFQRFLQDHEAGRWYRLADLYDYVSAQGWTKFRSPDRERRWELSKNAVAQNGGADVLETAVLKTIGLISVLEPVPGMRADARTVAWCAGADLKPTEAAIRRLTEKNLLYRRPHRDDFSLWASSSVDLDGWLEEARVKVQPVSRLDSALRNLPAASPLVAHKHYHRTGTLRAFAVLGWNGAGGPPEDLPPECDGAVIVVPQYPEESERAVAERIAKSEASTNPLRVFCVRKVGPEDLSAAHDLAVWRWIEENCKELRVDDLARREVRSRIASAEDALRTLLRPFVNPNGVRGERWFYRGKQSKIAHRRDLNRMLSDICDEVFPNTPILRNELINRASLSSATATARMRLLEAMVQSEAEPYLGMTGAPPERSIFLSMFGASRMHREGADGLRFRPPKPDDLNWMPAWEAVGAKLKAEGSCSFEELMIELGRPPVGLRRGPALLLIAGFMLHHRSEVAMMERNSFQPEISGAHFMRLAKSPANFSLRYLGHSKAALDLLERLTGDLTIWPEDGRPKPVLKEVVEATYRWWAALPSYAKETSTVSNTAKDLREVFRRALEPVDFVFKQLPSACGLEEFDIRKKDQNRLDRFIDVLDEALGDIADAPRRLRAKAETVLLEAFDAPTLSALREIVRNEYAPHRLQLSEYRLRSFVERATESSLTDDVWLDGIASLLTGKRFDAWQDDTVDAFGFESKAIATKLFRWLAHMREQVASDAKIVTVHVVDTSGQVNMVVVRPGSLAKESEKKVGEIRKILAGTKDPAMVMAHVMAGGMSVLSPKEKADG